MIFLGSGAYGVSAGSYCFCSECCVFFEGGGRVSPRRATHFSLLRQRKVSKRKATLSLRPLRVATGQTCGGALAGCAVELATRWRAALGQPRRVRLRGMRAKAPMLTPQTPRRRRSQKGVNRPTAARAIASLGPHRAGASATRCANWAERSDGPKGCPASGSLQDAPRSAAASGSGLAIV